MEQSKQMKHFGNCNEVKLEQGKLENRIHFQSLILLKKHAIAKSKQCNGKWNIVENGTAAQLSRTT